MFGEYAQEDQVLDASSKSEEDLVRGMPGPTIFGTQCHHVIAMHRRVQLCFREGRAEKIWCLEIGGRVLDSVHVGCHAQASEASNEQGKSREEMVSGQGAADNPILQQALQVNDMLTEPGVAIHSLTAVGEVSGGVAPVRSFTLGMQEGVSCFSLSQVLNLRFVASRCLF